MDENVRILAQRGVLTRSPIGVGPTDVKEWPAGLRSGLGGSPRPTPQEPVKVCRLMVFGEVATAKLWQSWHIFALQYREWLNHREEELLWVSHLAHNRVIGLLCFEIDVEPCHRSLVMEPLLEGFEWRDLSLHGLNDPKLRLHRAVTT